MVTIKHTRESIAKLEQEHEQFKQQRDSLIKDVEKLREEKAAIEMHLDAIKVYKPMYECVNDKYKYLTNHIKDKAIHNPGVHRYIDLVHVIDELEMEWESIAKINYKKEWDRLKQRVITDYITLSSEEETADNVETLAGEIIRLEKVGEYMDWLDDTHEFKNLLDDINKEDK